MMTREQWLGSALAIVRMHLRDTAAIVVPDDVKVSCGFPGGGSARTRIGECWDKSASDAQHSEIFISPILSDSSRVLDILIHEAIHAALGAAEGHKKLFRKAALAAGLEGKMTATVASDALKETLKGWVEQLGTYPHDALNLSNRKKQSTRLIKVICNGEGCGYTLRTTAKWIDKCGAPMCPVCVNDYGECLRMTVDITESEDGE